MIVTLIVFTTTFWTASSFLCSNSCPGSEGIQCYAPVSCEPEIHSAKCHDKQCLEMTIYNKDQKIKEMTIIDQEVSNLQISSIELLEVYPGSVNCNLSTAIRFTYTKVVVDAGCKVNFLVCFQIHYRGVVMEENLKGDCQVIRLENDGPLRIVSMDPTSRSISSMAHVTPDYIIDKRCIFGKTFGFYQWHIFTRNGCSGRFKICFQNSNVEDHHEDPEQANGEPYRCTQVKLNSRIKRPAEMRITGLYGHQVTIHSLKLLQQFSEIDCVEGETFDYSEDLLRAWGGCRGTFQVCYLTESGYKK